MKLAGEDKKNKAGAKNTGNQMMGKRLSLIEEYSRRFGKRSMRVEKRIIRCGMKL